MPINVKTDCGAIGDGTTDDTEAFEDAMAKVSLEDGPDHDLIKVPVGFYRVKRKLLLNKTQGVRIVGAGNVGEEKGSGITRS